MGVGDIFALAADNIGTIFIWIFIGSGIVQFSPLKINPWSYIAKKIGRAINGEVIDKVGNVEIKLNKLENNVDKLQAIDRRVRILNFNDEILRNLKHSKDSFNQILEDIDFYEQYCEKHKDFKNNRAVLAINNIKNTYNNCMQNRDFL